MSGRTGSFLSQIKWGESYTSLFLGAAVVIVALVLLFSFFKSKNLNNGKISSNSTVSNQQTGNKELPKTYTIKQGDDLWSVAQSIYGSGYNWVDLANVNKLKNPSILYVGTKLVVPNVTPRVITNQVEQPKPITQNTYTVKKGDYLWSIAIRAYGDGYKWIDIASANNLANPNLIFSGNVLKLPR